MTLPNRAESLATLDRLKARFGPLTREVPTSIMPRAEAEAVLDALWQEQANPTSIHALKAEFTDPVDPKPFSRTPNIVKSLLENGLFKYAQNPRYDFAAEQTVWEAYIPEGVNRSFESYFYDVYSGRDPHVRGVPFAKGQEEGAILDAFGFFKSSQDRQAVIDHHKAKLDLKIA